MGCTDDQDGKVLSNEELTQVVIGHILDNLEEFLDTCGHIGVRFPYSREDGVVDDLPNNKALVQVDRDDRGEVSISIGVLREGTDRLYSHCLFEAGSTVEDVRAWLADTDRCVPIIMDGVRNLSHRVDEYW